MKELFKTKKNILNVYLTAGFPKLHDTVEIVTQLAKNKVDIVEIGMPFSDPLADGPTIQNSSKIAIKNGITINTIFNQIIEIRKKTSIPILLMGYYNQLLRYGADNFFKKAKEVGVNGLIIPDLPIAVYKKDHKKMVKKLNLDMIFLITPQTSDQRIKMIDKESSGFIYVVSSYSITGSKNEINKEQINYFSRIEKMQLKNPKLIGFGIHNKQTFDIACKYANGAIIGSAFIKQLEKSKNLKWTIQEFVKSIREG
ncbi:MAG TPA: tryptophan synthase subunit alpha [Flavobacteriia bacterium]|nr:tryptophan synthase subunit alpha [Flavobacteriia bacterium]